MLIKLIVVAFDLENQGRELHIISPLPSGKITKDPKQHAEKLFVECTEVDPSWAKISLLDIDEELTGYYGCILPLDTDLINHRWIKYKDSEENNEKYSKLIEKLCHF